MIHSKIGLKLISSNKLLKCFTRFQGSVVKDPIIEAKLKAAKPFTEIPSLPMFPIIGTAWIYMPLIGKYRLDEQHIANNEKRKKFGDIMRERVGSFNFVLCYRAEDLQEILRNEGSYPNRVEFTTIRAYRETRKHWYSTSGLLSIQGKEWHNLRTKSQKHLLRPGAIVDYLEPIQDVANDFVERLYKIKDLNNEVPNFLQELYKWTLESVCLIGLDARMGCLRSDLSPDSDGARMIRSVLTQFHCMQKLEAFSGRIQFWRLFPTPTWRKFTRASDDYAKFAAFYPFK